MSVRHVTDSIVMTLHNRHPFELGAVIHSLAQNDLRETEIVMVDDGSAAEMSEVYKELAHNVDSGMCPCKYIAMPEYDAYRIKGHNNPAKANNVALQEVRGERLFWLSSDVELHPNALERARRFKPGEAIYICRIVDTHSFGEFLGPSRMFPMMWFVGTSASACREIGGFDEAYLLGMAFEDNDFMGRLSCHIGSILTDWQVTCFHRSHPQIAYSDDYAGFERSEAYTVEKWGGVPFGDDRTVKCIPMPHHSGLIEWKTSSSSIAVAKKVSA